MKTLKDLKYSIIEHKEGNVFVFNDVEWAIKKHYIEEIRKQYKKIEYLDSTAELAPKIVSKSLFRVKTLYVISHDEEFLKENKKAYVEILTKLSKLPDGVIWIYECELSKTFQEEFEPYITNFTKPDNKIFDELIFHDMKLTQSHLNCLRDNCENNYSLATIEIDKIKQYADCEGVSNDIAFDVLYNNEDLVERVIEFDSNLFMNGILTGTPTTLAYCMQCLESSGYENIFTHIESIMNDFKIAYYIKKDGKYDGGSLAYNNGLFWGRIKEIRELHIIYPPDVLLYLANQVAHFDYLYKLGRISDKDVIEHIICLVV